MRIGITLLPELDWHADRERWRRAEAYGFDHAWTFDHLAWRTLADGPWHATIPTLTAAALATSTIRIGTLVTTPNFRHPVPLAKDLMTLDVISRGRLDVALGAGAPGYDAAVLGGPALSPRQRQERFAEFCGMLDQLLSNPVTDRSGDWYTAVGARMIPGPTQRPRPPLLVGAEGPRGMRLAATAARRAGDGWLTLGGPDRTAADGPWWAAVRATVARMDEILAAAGPVPDGFVRMLNLESRMPSSVGHLRDHLGRAAELGFTDVALAWPRGSEPFRGDEAVLENIAAALPELRRAGGSTRLPTAATDPRP